MDNPSDRTTVEIHVYSRDLADLQRCGFDPEDRKAISYESGN